MMQVRSVDHDLEIKSYSPAQSFGQARRRAALMLLTATLIALVPCFLIFTLVLYGEWMTRAFGAIADLMFKQPVWAITAATSPLAGALLVGYGYMQRAIRRRAEQRQASADTDEVLH